MNLAEAALPQAPRHKGREFFGCETNLTHSTISGRVVKN